MRTAWMGCAALALTGCVGEPEDDRYYTELLAQGHTEDVAKAIGPHRTGELLFTRETFEGNGRTCSSCHIAAQGGTIDPDFVQEAFADDPSGPLFDVLDSDNREGLTWNRLMADATILIDFDLPAGLFICGVLPSDCVCEGGQCADSGITHLVLPRATTSTMNNPGHETIFMTDGREPTLQQQAVDAVNQHFAPGRQPTALELDLIAAFQQNDRKFYSSKTLFEAGLGEIPLPPLPPGNTASEQRGRAFFENTADGLCGHCHGGPFLNESTAFLLVPPGTFEPGSRTMPLAQVSLLNPGGAPVYTYCFDDLGSDEDGAFDICADPFFADTALPPEVPRPTRANPFGVTPATSPDPGLILTTGVPSDFSAFRIPTLWGIADTAPYFHDNHAKTLEEMMAHYVAYFAGPPAFRDLTDQEVADIVAFLKLLK